MLSLDVDADEGYEEGVVWVEGLIWCEIFGVAANLRSVRIGYMSAGMGGLTPRSMA